MTEPTILIEIIDRSRTNWYKEKDIGQTFEVITTPKSMNFQLVDTDENRSKLHSEYAIERLSKFSLGIRKTHARILEGKNNSFRYLLKEEFSNEI